MTHGRPLLDGDYHRLLEIRTGLRRFLHWSEEQARAAGLTPAQHQLLLAVRGHRGSRPQPGAPGDGSGQPSTNAEPPVRAPGDPTSDPTSDPTGYHTGDPTIGDLAEHLLLRHHSVVQLVDRAARSGLVTRRRDEQDHRIVHVALTRKGSHILESLAAAHVEELGRVGLSFADLSTGLSAGAPTGVPSGPEG